MRAITVIPGQQGSVALTDMPEPPADDGPIVVQTQAIGICGTDLEIINGEYGSAPPGQERLIIGHESLGRVGEAAPETGFAPGDLVVGIVRRRDPVPCPACAAGHWDMCVNGQYTERGIKDRHGYASERYRIHPEYLVAVDPALGMLGVLLEPATVVAKAWDHIEKIGRRAAWAPEKVLVTGAGPIGLLAALLATQRGYQTYVVDLVTGGRKPEMVRRLGATYVQSGDLGEAAAEADIVIECTGHIQMLLEASPRNVRYRITCLTGVSAAGAEATVNPGLLNRNMVLQNSVLFGSVNANRRHYELAAQALAQADRGWLADLITRDVPLDRWEDAYTRKPDDIKTIVNFCLVRTGATIPSDAGSSYMPDLERNKQVVVDYYQTAFDGNLEKATSDHVGDRYVQHNPDAADGPEAFIAFVTWLRGEYPNLRLDIKQVIAEGDMVVTHSHLDLEPGNPDNPGRALADFFRLENGKVVEHWDVIQDVPKTAANANGMF